MLFELNRGPATLSVSQVNNQARQLLERSFGVVSVVGEVSNLKVVSGHVYFSLKDREAQLPAVMFRREASALRFELRGGMEVVARGRLTIYGAQGKYQLVADRVEPRGAGALQAAFEELKAKLAAEGLFAGERKRELPLIPRCVAVVTSPTGAVIRDIVNVATRRHGRCSILVVPTRVQGPESAAEIAAAVQRAGALSQVRGIDVIIVARGGGSLEDLWGFNDERVARAIAASPVPVVSAVGHETDVTIADFVADVRAPTPSAAAELVFPIAAELSARLQRPLQRAHRALASELTHGRRRLGAAERALGDGRWITREAMQRLDAATERLAQALRRRVGQERTHLQRLERALAHAHPRVRLQATRGRLDQALTRITLLTRQRIAYDRRRLAGEAQRLNALSPLAVLERGYGIVLGPEGRAVRAASEVRVGERIEVRLSRGRVGARVEDKDDGSDERP